MRYILAFLMISLIGCASPSHNYNPLDGPPVRVVSPSSVTEYMPIIQAHLKQIVNQLGIHNTTMYYIINDTQQNANLAVFDVTITVQEVEKRYILGIKNGVVDYTREIELEAEVNCQHERDEYEGRDRT